MTIASLEHYSKPSATSRLHCKQRLFTACSWRGRRPAEPRVRRIIKRCRCEQIGEKLPATSPRKDPRSIFAGVDGEMSSQSQVLLFVPNLVGYFRIALIFTAIAVSTDRPQLCWWLFLVNFILDGFDGALARRLGQTSSFGAFLDVVIDNTSRGILWTWSIGGPLGCIPVILEMLAFVCTHRGGGAQWRTGYFANAPSWVQAVMKNGFKSPAGCIAIIGLMGFPMWLWAVKFLPGTFYSSFFVAAVTLPGRALAGMVELWIIKRHVQGLLKEDVR